MDLARERGLTEVDYIRRNWADAVTRLQENRETILADGENLLVWEDRIIRSLARLGRHDEALAIARTSTERDLDPWFEAVVQAAAGNVEETIDAMRHCLSTGAYTPEQFYADDDMGPALRSEAFAPLRELWPAPAKDE